MKSPTKRIFYHFGVTRSAFGTSTFTTTPILARYQPVDVPACTCPPASLPSVRTYTHAYARAGTQKSLVAQRYQAFSEAKCLS